MLLITPKHISTLSRLDRVLSGPQYADAKYFLLVDENSYQHCLPEVISHVTHFQQAEFMEVPVGEDCKAPDIAAGLWQTLLDSHADSHAVLVNIGGGCVTDLGGFVAATYHRGIRHINIPTTLVGMADAAIGGKTALNIGGSKNQIGLFRQPEIVCICPDFLNTLPDEHIFAGIFEMLKTFLIGSPEHYRQLCDMILSGTLDILPDHLATCANIKNAIVRRDLHDTSLRHILNLGHTFGHAIEAHSLQPGHKPLPHGHAVGIGLVCALYLSINKLGLPQSILDNYRLVASKLITLPHYTLADTEELLTHIRRDKKNAHGQILCVLLQDLGAPVIDLAIDENEIRTALLQL